VQQLPAPRPSLHSTSSTDARPPAALHLLALNSGSSSLKFGLYRVRDAHAQCLLSGQAEGLGSPAATLQATDAEGRSLPQESTAPANAADAVLHIARLLAAHPTPPPQAIGHRIVHGGPALRRHVLIDPQVLAQLEAACAFAPLHTPAAMALIQGAAAHFPGLPQVACLDTCFHAGMPPVASTLPLPLALRTAGIERYGFHGLSCESIVQQLGRDLPERLLIAHLGNGASVTAVQRGRSIDTSMGLSPTGGLIMGTRSGDLDPGVLVHLLRKTPMDAGALETLVDHRCGLLGISGLSGDMRALHAAAGSNSQARLAIEMFCYRVAKELGAMAVALGGAELIVFTGGIGEHDPLVRAAICARLSSLGVRLDAARNAQGQGLVSSEAAACAVQVLPSQEDAQIARHTGALCGLRA
jgi:acetate kinase